MRVVTEFRYLGRVLTATDDEWPAVAGNIRKARESWGQLARVLGREGADPKVSHSFYTDVTQQVLLFGAESWVLTTHMESALDAFQGRVALRLTGRQPRRGRDRKWFYPSLTRALKEAGVMRARTSVLRRQNTVAQFIAWLYSVSGRPMSWPSRPPPPLELPSGRGRTIFCPSPGGADVLSNAVPPFLCVRAGS